MACKLIEAAKGCWRYVKGIHVVALVWAGASSLPHVQRACTKRPGEAGRLQGRRLAFRARLRSCRL